MTASVTIRKFAPEDAARLQEIRDAAFKPVFQSFRDIVGPKIAAVALAGAEKEQADLLDRLCATGSAHKIFIAECDGVIAGFCAVKLDAETGIGEIDLNAVDPEFQGRGVGGSLYDYALARMRETGMRIATVGTGGDASHAPARRAYGKAGFTTGIPSVFLYRTL